MINATGARISSSIWCGRRDWALRSKGWGSYCRPDALVGAGDIAITAGRETPESDRYGLW